MQKNHLVIDENTSYIVKDIFKMYLDGNSVYYIRDYLNKKNIYYSEFFRCLCKSFLYTGIGISFPKI